MGQYNNNDPFNQYNQYNQYGQQGQPYGMQTGMNNQQFGGQGYQQAYNQGYGQPYGAAYTPADTISSTKYNLIIGACLLYGFIINCIMVSTCYDAAASLIMGSPIVFFILYLAMAIAGGLMVHKSDNPVISFIGYNLFVLPLGLVLSFVLNVYVAVGYSDIITQAFGLTAAITLIMMAVSSIFPDFFLKLGRTLMITLLITIVAEFVMYLMGANLGIIDYVVVLIFCGYIGYDWAKANRVPKTVDNAIDSAAELYVDMVNLFLRLLRILARAQSN